MKKGEIQRKSNPNVNNPGWKSYNGESLREGEVLVPFLVDDREFAVILGMIPDHMRVWSKGGVPFNVMFIPVPEEQAEALLKEFNSSVNELLDQKLGRNRYSRCLVPQKDGSRKPCPKLKKGNHLPCAKCPHKGKYEREDRNILSLEELKEKNPDIAGNVPSAEDTCLEMEILQDLLKHLRTLDPRLADIVTMRFEGLERKEIVQKLPVGTTQAYALYKKAEEASREYLKR